MMPCKRPAPPEVLTDERVEEWTTRFTGPDELGALRDFYWPTVRGQTLNKHLLPSLRTMTARHCAYCDAWPSESYGESIDHFRPKSKFRALAYEWENLFPACTECQKAKRDDWDDRALSPTEPGYSFKRYFIVRLDGTIDPRPNASRADQYRAKFSIEFFGLNRAGRPTARAREWQMQRNVNDRFADLPSEDRPYRFLGLESD